jgi:hypothetical protein
MTITVQNNQSLLDLAIQVTGRAENFLKIAMANNLVPTELIAPGTILIIPDDIEIDEEIVRYYNANNIVPATELTEIQTKSVQLTFWQRVVKALTN